MAKLGVAVVGVGTMGKQHAHNLRRLIPEARLVAVVDADLKRAEQVATELEVDRVYNSVEAEEVYVVSVQRPLRSIVRRGAETNGKLQISPSGGHQPGVFDHSEMAQK